MTTPTPNRSNEQIADKWSEYLGAGRGMGRHQSTLAAITEATAAREAEIQFLKAELESARNWRTVSTEQAAAIDQLRAERDALKKELERIRLAKHLNHSASGAEFGPFFEETDHKEAEKVIAERAGLKAENEQLNTHCERALPVIQAALDYFNSQKDPTQNEIRRLLLLDVTKTYKIICLKLAHNPPIT